MPTLDPDGSLDAFLTAVSTLSADQFARVREAGKRLGPAPRIAARKEAKLSASEFSNLDKRVRDAVRPRHEELAALGDGALSAAIHDTLFAAHGIARRTQLNVEQYDALVAPFAVVEVPIPAHDA
ncbi:hypothetical protein [Agromyces larvae]|uniref:DUF222 domain-containing protein n=1 Tax=Agromyces larvae TaxID=2929802 RepID=A0ABY4BTV2_9MICO|nr:hypothetical protein [Agromyces larvae]UOE42642.1 hypothetical protein MTO99_10590 [Agromyces larvae]